MKLFNKNNKNGKIYNYMITYSFKKKAGKNLEYSETAIGRIFWQYTKKIETQEDVFEIENSIKDTINIENLENLFILSFNLLDC